MRFKLNLLILLMVTAVLVLSSIVSYYDLREQLEVRFEDNKRTVIRRLQANLPTALWNYDEQQLTQVLKAELASPEIASIRVFQSVPGMTGGTTALVMRVDREPGAAAESDADDVVAFSVPLPEGAALVGAADGDPREIGSARVFFSREPIAQLLASQVRSRILDIVVLNLVLGGVLFFVMSRMVITPLARLSQAFKELAHNPQVGEIKMQGKDEFGEVVDAFNQIERRLVLDIERQTKAEISLRETNAELSEALDTLRLAQESLVESEKFASLGSLVAGVAHEINTPVGVAVTGASYLVDEAQRMQRLLEEGQVRKSEIVQFLATVAEGASLVLGNAERAAQLIQSFKQVAADETSEARRMFDLKNYLNEVLSSLRPKFKKTAIRVSIDCPESIVMDSYPGLLAQVITNLVTNAFKHGFDDGASGEVVLRARVESQWVVIECANNGKLIPPDHLPKVFEPFFTTRRSDGGTGLGLNIVFNIVNQRLGGTIKVSSREGDGTVFSVRIPMILKDKPRGG